jgi:hypothetical protein
MIEFTIVYKTGKKEKIKSESKSSMIRDFSTLDPSAFQEKVKEFHWTTEEFHYIENIASGKIQEIEILEGGKDF